MPYIKQCKGKQLKDITTNNIVDNNIAEYYTTTKWDGNYIQVQNDADGTRFYTSSGKELEYTTLAIEVHLLFGNLVFTLEMETISNTEGKLGDRFSKDFLSTTSSRVHKSKGLQYNISNTTFKVFNLLAFKSHTVSLLKVAERYDILRELATKFSNNTYFSNKVHFDFEIPMLVSLDQAKLFANEKVLQGYEGAMAVHKDHSYRTTRCNSIIKLKKRPTADLLCIGVVAGKGKYEGLIGSLTLQDSSGIVVNVGSGLTDEERHYAECEFIGSIIEIEYEQKSKVAYLQPTFITIRTDKSTGD